MPLDWLSTPVPLHYCLALLTPAQLALPPCTLWTRRTAGMPNLHQVRWRGTEKDLSPMDRIGENLNLQQTLE
jgi:hypothetical protein